MKKPRKLAGDSLPQSEPSRTVFLELLQQRLSQAIYGKRTPQSVGKLMSTMQRLKHDEMELSRMERELGEARIDAAQSRWLELSGKTTLLFGTDAIPEIVEQHPEVDQSVYEWLKRVANFEKERDHRLAEVGGIVVGAYQCADLAFFKSLYATLCRHAEIDDRTRWTKLTLLVMVNGRHGFHLPYTLSEITEHLRSLWYTPEDKDLDRSYVSRLCKDMGIVVKPGKSGPPPKHQNP
jgi:hypothetical protein